MIGIKMLQNHTQNHSSHIRGVLFKQLICSTVSGWWGCHSFPEAPATSVEGDGLEPDGSSKVRDRPGADVYAQAVHAAGAEGAKGLADGAGNAESGREKEVLVAWSW